MTPPGPPENRLAQETSPYLLQHADNPVAWWAWGPDALAAAATDNKPILLSVGYAACHWCHVMAHESFEDPEIAALMNRLFINIKVDREERPDIDHIYQQALALLGQQGGWPLTMFLTPDGSPFWGGTYFPSEQRYGRPSFPQVLEAVAETFGTAPEKIAKNVQVLTEGLSALAQNQSGPPVDLQVMRRLATRLVREFDPFWGGIARAPKFPQTAILELIWRAHLATGDDVFKTAITKTLTQMAQGGIYDHLAGGFARYSVDEEWLVPHFEKMLYDNAQLIEIMTLVWQETGDPLLRLRVEETIRWLDAEMIAEHADGRPSGAFAATLDADSEGVEGKFYVWSEAEIDALLGDHAALFKSVYDVTPEGNFEGATILNRRRSPGLLSVEEEALLHRCRTTLLTARAGRVRPGWDDKVLADWNGLMITALCKAGFAFGRQDWIDKARTAFDAVVALCGTPDGRLLHSWRRGTAQHLGMLDDYAGMIRAALALHEATGDQSFLDSAIGWTAVLDQRFWDPDGGGYFVTADDADAMIIRAKTANDNATPPGNGLMLGNLMRLYLLTGQDRFRHRCDALRQAFSGEVERNAFALATFLNNCGFCDQALQIVLVGDRGRDDARTLLTAIAGRSLPDRLVTVIPPSTALPTGHPAAGKGQVDGRATAYVCRGPVCSLPVTDPEALLSVLDTRDAAA